MMDKFPDDRVERDEIAYDLGLLDDSSYEEELLMSMEDVDEST